MAYQTSASLDMTAKSFDLARALLDFSNSSSMTDVGVRIIKWLARERIDDASFAKCCQLARSLAYPNTNGLEIRASLEEADKKISNVRTAPIRLVVSGSLGRLLSHDPEFCYMVSSVAILTKFHEPQYVAEILSSMVLDKGGHQEAVSYRYNIQRAPIKAVISKIVESIYINVINSGHTLEGLPQELEHLHIHLLDYTTFAGIVMGIQRTEKDILIVSDRFPGDLTAWLLCHFEGTFQIIVERTTTFKKRLGTRSRMLKMVIRKLCPSDVACLNTDASIEASESVGHDSFTFLRGTDDSDFRPCSYSRQSLYSTSNTMSTPRASKSSGLDEAQENHITAVAKDIVGWLIDIPLKSQDRLCDYAFKVSLDEQATECDLTIGHLLVNHPSLTHAKTGKLKISGPVYRGKEDSLYESPEYFDEENSFTFSPELDDILSHFPYAQAMLNEMKAICRCFNCTNDGSMLKECKRGCLRHSAVTKLFILLAHAISDGFGAPNVSGLTEPENLKKGVTEVFSELIFYQVIRWDTWFQLVACTVAGCEWESFDTSDASEPKAPVAIQYGNFIAVAPWLDLRREISISGSFGLTFLEGNIEGLPDDIGILHSEDAEYTSTDNISQNPKPDKSVRRGELQLAMTDHFDLKTPTNEPINIQDALQLDTVKPQVKTAIFRVDANHYRIMTMVEAGSYLLIVDPVKVLLAMKKCQIPDCSHEIDKPSAEHISSTQCIAIDDFDRILDIWTAGPGSTIQMSKVLDSQVKLNTALSLSHLGCIVRPHDSCCMSCAIAGLLKLKSRGSPRIISKATPTGRRFLPNSK